MAGVALLLGADRLMDSMRVSVNLLGNCVATFVVPKWEGQFDREAMLRAFRGELSEGEPADDAASERTTAAVPAAGVEPESGAPALPAQAAGVR